MDYSTFTNKTFFIKQNSTLPKLKFALTQHIRENYDITDQMLNNVGVTFSMKNKETGIYQIANVAGDLIINRDRENYPDEEEYTLVYNFRLRDTKKVGRFQGEFKLDFIGEKNGGKITLPNNEPINIIIGDSLTKTTVI